MALLYVLDDGRRSAEILRIRSSPFVIGRTVGDCIIPHDEQISSQHVQIVRTFRDGRHIWYLQDLESRNGTFVLATHLVLKHGQILVLGGSRFEFSSEDKLTADSPVEKGEKPDTRHWKDEATERSLPRLVDLSHGTTHKELELTASECFLGRDMRECSIVIDDERVLSRHARVYQDSFGRWYVEQAAAGAEIWAQVRSIRFGVGACFQCGEQRFVVRTI